MKLPTSRQGLLVIGIGASALAAGSVALTALLDLHPCHLCIFQRLLFMLIGVTGIVAALPATHLRAMHGGSILIALAALVGVCVAAYQSWLQLQPPGSISCAGGEPGSIERLVEWLGGLSPTLFLATGFCEEEELAILGLSLANWALVAFGGILAAALWTLTLAFRKQALHHGGIS